MDILYEPADPCRPPPDKTPYLSDELWDGQLFRLYPHRKGMTQIVPTIFGQIPGIPLPEKPYQETLYPTAKETLQPFIQTWLFFGLVSEFLGLNEVEPGVWLMDRDAAKAEIAALHQQCLDEDEPHKFLTAQPLLKIGPLIRERIQLAPDRVQRVLYLRDCLRFTSAALHVVEGTLDDSVRYSISAVGEIFATAMFAAVTLSPLKDRIPAAGFSWHQNYIRAGGTVETQMLADGWCPCEIERIRTEFTSQLAMHYVGRMKKPGRPLDHSKCSTDFCAAFQLDLSTYQSSHATDTCTCSHIGLGESVVDGILRSTDTYPVIRLDHFSGDLDSLKIVAEPYDGSTPYVALSHVWANGLGNPVSTTLPRCQIARLFGLLQSMQDRQRQESGKTGPPFRLWLDTLCCPVERSGKLIALERIADVYRDATHVLVLDASITPYQYEGTHPAELLLRVYISSPWMRRLWTLQEGSLSNSLYVQFADQAVDHARLLKELYILGTQDFRCFRIWQDVSNESQQIQVLCAKNRAMAANGKPPATLVSLQRALHYRTLTVASDEPLCIATLMNLDIKYIGSPHDGETRMVRVWELLIKANGGISSQVIFYVDEGLETPGWRWAPKSLLGSSSKDSAYGLDYRVMRFNDAPFAAGLPYSSIGIPTHLGLRVNLPGCRLTPKPLLKGLPLHPWPDLIYPTEDQVLLWDESQDKWMRIIDHYRSRKLGGWTREKKKAWDDEMNNPICRAIDTGRCHLIYNPGSMLGNGTQIALLVDAEEVTADERQDPSLGIEEHHPALKVRRGRTVIMSSITDAEQHMMKIVRSLSVAVAKDKVTEDLQSIQDRTGQEWEDGLVAVRRRCKEVMAEAWRTEPELVETVQETIGMDLETFVWTLLAKLFSHDTVMEDVPKEQIWFVD